jgi:hypothetical protein
MNIRAVCLGACLISLPTSAGAAEPLPPTVDEATLKRVHEAVKTPFKYGIVLRGAAAEKIDCPCVFSHRGKWFMWTKWTGPDLIAPSEPWDQQYAHKPWVVRANGIVYHFYCAVGNEGRVIALATSKDLKAPAGPE